MLIASRKWFFVLFVCCCAWTSLELHAQPVPFRVVTYNVLRLSDNDQERQQALATIFAEVQPDILLTQEMVNTDGVALLLSALNASDTLFANAPFINGADTDNALFYRKDRVRFISQDTVDTALREFSEYTVEVAGNTFNLYSAHLKAGDGPWNENLRYDEAEILRMHLNSLPDSVEFIVAGDLNIGEDNEAAYQLLTRIGSDSTGQLVDLVEPALIGRWRNNPAFAAVHSQSPRAIAIGGGASGGMDDRFDFILGSQHVFDTEKIAFKAGSYTVYGNDGQHFNKAITDGPNLVVSDDMAQALHDASDHLPVYADFVSYTDSSVASAPVLMFSEIFYDTPGTDADEEWVELYNNGTGAVDLAGWSLVDNNGDGFTYTFPESHVMQAGTYFTVANDANAFVALYGYGADLYDNIPPLNNSGDALLLRNPADEVMDEVAWEGGASKGVPALWNSDLEPNARRGESLVRASFALDTDSFEDWIIATGNGSPQVQGTGVEFHTVGTDTGLPQRVASLDQNYPNPVANQTAIKFLLPVAQTVSLTVFDMLGREVAQLAHGTYGAGEHTVTYVTEALNAGVYIYRLQTEAGSQVRQMLVIR
ncbi:MAG: lamin tail domain-containing protein [Bacteroidota bacterium]